MRNFSVLALILLISIMSFGQITYQGPLYITKAGKYTGNYRSDDPGTPAVLVFCYDSVEITGCNILSSGIGIKAYGGSKINAHHNTITGQQPTGNEQWGRAADIYQPQSFRFEYNTVDHTGGVRLDHQDANTKQVYIRYNEFKNTDKRRVDGSEGDHRAAVLFDGLVGIDGEISWNQFINEPNKSWIEDNINLRNSGGKSTNPFLIKNNYIRGAYPAPLDYNTSRGTNYTGSGITIEGDPSTNQYNNVAQFVNVENNQVISTMNGGINVNHGHDIYVRKNTIISSGQVNGTYYKSFWGGGAIWNGSNLSTDVFKNIVYENNTVGYYRKDVFVGGTDRQDWVIVPGSPISVDPAKNTSLPNPITVAMEDAEFPKWTKKLADNGITIGAGGTAVPPVVVTPIDTIVVAMADSVVIKVGESKVGKVMAVNSLGVATTFKAGSVSLLVSGDLSLAKDAADETLFTITGVKTGRSTITVTLTTNAGKILTKTIGVTAVTDPSEATDIRIKIPYHG